MASNIDISFVRQYSNTIYDLVQVTGGKFSGRLREESVDGESKSFETFDKVSASLAGAQNSASPITDTVHGRRVLTPLDFEIGLMVDQWDKRKLAVNPEANYIRNAVASLMRQKDIQVITGALGDAYTGKTGATTVNFDYANQVVGSDAEGMNIGKLRAIRTNFAEAGYDMENPTETFYVYVSPKQMDELLAQDEITSIDYNNVKAGVNGRVAYYMGIEIVETNLVPYMATDDTVELTWATTGNNRPIDTDATGIRACFAYVKSGLVCGTNPDIETRVTERDDLRFNWYTYNRLATATIRMEEQAVILVPCLEA